jgi:Zn-dependent peptidase ImmA (M78 family)/transcriptional regulator with XRE-family HTH domain
MRSSPEVAFISPNVLKWALDNGPLSRPTIAKKLKVDEASLHSWETTKSVHPPFAKAKELAKLLHVPFGYLFLSEPPEVELPLPDFRGTPASYVPSLEFRELLNDVLVKQDWYREHLRASNAPRLGFVGSFDTSDTVMAVAADIRKQLGIDPALRRSAKSWSEFVSKLSDIAEAAGVLVMRSSVVGHSTRRKLSRSEFQGFAIADSRAPLVFVNSADFKAAQVFTLAHELAHIWIGQSAISNTDEAEAPTRNRIESFCNRTATEVLVPRAEFLSVWNPAADVDGQIQHLARQYWVSTLVVLRRAYELGQLSDSQFFSTLATARSAQKKEQGGGGSFYRNITSRMSRRLTATVLNEVHQGHILLTDAARLLSLKVPTLVKFADRAK